MRAIPQFEDRDRFVVGYVGIDSWTPIESHPTISKAYRAIAILQEHENNRVKRKDSQVARIVGIYDKEDSMVCYPTWIPANWGGDNLGVYK